MQNEEQESRTFLQQHHARKPIIQIPEINTTDASLVIQLPIDIKRLVRSNLHLPHPLARHRALPGPLIAMLPHPSITRLIERWLELSTPRRAVAVAVAVIVAQKVVAASFPTPADGQRLVDGGEEVFG
jgi:hypothetical protein